MFYFKQEKFVLCFCFENVQLVEITHQIQITGQSFEYMCHVSLNENGELETSFRHNQDLYCCNNNKIPNKTNWGETQQVIFIMYALSSNEMDSIKLENYIFDNRMLQVLSRKATKLLDAKKYDEIKQEKRNYQLSKSQLEKRKEVQRKIDKKRGTCNIR